MNNENLLNRLGKSAFKLRTKLILTTVLLIVGSVSAIIYSIYQQTDNLQKEKLGSLGSVARSIQDKIDHNLFERYCNVQSFALNATLHRNLDSISLQDRDEIAKTINAYMTGYGCYSLSVILDPKGNISAINTVDDNGKALDSVHALLGRDLSGEGWFNRLKNEDYTTSGTPDSLTGTVVGKVQKNELVKEVYGTNAPAWNMSFSAPIKGADGTLYGYWHNILNSVAIEKIAGDAYAFLEKQDLSTSEITVLSPDGFILVDVDPTVSGSTDSRPGSVLELNLAKAGVSFAVDGTNVAKDPNGNGFARHKRKSEKIGSDYIQAGAYARSVPLNGIPGTGLVSLVRVDQDQAFDMIARLTNASIWVGVGSVSIGLLIIFFVSGEILKRVYKLRSSIQKLAKGDLSQTLETDSKDEIGDTMHALDDTIRQLRQVVNEVSVAADNVASGAEEMSSTAQQISDGASQQSAAAEESNSSMEQMNSSIQQNADNARHTDQIANQAAEGANTSNEAVSKAVTAMKQISTKIEIVEEIARKTDLLALNAAVEAARAGEHGRGFSVVASEVRKLAERSALAAAEISQVSHEGVGLASQAGEKLTALVPDIRKTAELVQEINVASSEQSSGVSEIHKALKDLDQVIQNNASSSEEMASTAEELSSQAQQLLDSIGFFNLETTNTSLNGSSRQQQSAVESTHDHSEGFTNGRSQPVSSPNGGNQFSDTDSNRTSGQSVSLTGANGGRSVHDDYEQY